MNSLKHLVFILWNKKKILFLTTLIEHKKRYAGSVLGMSWILLYPAILLSMYMFIYQAVFKVKVTGIGSSFEYSLFVLSGIIPYLGFAEVLNGSVLSLSQNRHLISNVTVPMEVIPARIVCSGLVTQCIGLLILMGLLLFAGGKVSAYWAFVPLMLIIEFFFLSGLAFLFSALGVLLRDLAQVMAILTLFLLFVSPVGYTKEMVPENLQFFLYLNPLWYIVESFREPLLYARLPDYTLLGIYLLASAVVFCLGGIIFKKALHVLSDLA